MLLLYFNLLLCAFPFSYSYSFITGFAYGLSGLTTYAIILSLYQITVNIFVGFVLMILFPFLFLWYFE